MCDECYELNDKYGKKRRYKKGGDRIWHCLSEPAREYADGDWIWYKDNRPHREDGPAAFLYGMYYFWLEGIRYDEQEYCVKIKEYRKDKLEDL